MLPAVRPWRRNRKRSRPTIRLAARAAARSASWPALFSRADVVLMRASSGTWVGLSRKFCPAHYPGEGEFLPTLSAWGGAPKGRRGALVVRPLRDHVGSPPAFGHLPSFAGEEKPSPLQALGHFLEHHLGGAAADGLDAGVA